MVSSVFHVDDRQHEVWFRSSQGPLSDGVDAFVAASIVPAMNLGYAVQAPGPVSGQLLAGIQAFQQLMHSWFPKLKVIPVLAEARTSSPPRAAGEGSFFSCGVDACYTFLKHYPKITAAILIHGFDYQHQKELTKKNVSTMARNAMTKLGRNLIEVETNIREFGDQYANWASEYHGSILATIGMLLSPQLGTLYIGSSFHYDERFPWASHPDLDPLWNSETTEIVHDGTDVTRSQKVSFISRSDAALSILRVCFKEYRKQGTTLNCGKCEKCIRTMMDLRIAGALDRCSTFRHPLRLKDIALTDVRFIRQRLCYEGSLKQLQKVGNDPSLEKALQECLSNQHYLGWEGFCRAVTRQVYRKTVRNLMRPFEQGARLLANAMPS